MVTTKYLNSVEVEQIVYHAALRMLMSVLLDLALKAKRVHSAGEVHVPSIELKSSEPVTLELSFDDPIVTTDYKIIPSLRIRT